MGVAFVSVGVMIYVLIVFGLRDDNATAPTQPTGAQPHAGAQHHAADPHEGGKPAPLQVYAGSVVGSALDAARGNALDEVTLEEQVQDDDGNRCQRYDRHHRRP